MYPEELYLYISERGLVYILGQKGKGDRLLVKKRIRILTVVEVLVKRNAGRWGVLLHCVGKSTVACRCVAGALK